MRRAMAGLTTFQTWKGHISAFELDEKCKATYGSAKIGGRRRILTRQGALGRSHGSLASGRNGSEPCCNLPPQEIPPVRFGLIAFKACSPVPLLSLCARCLLPLHSHPPPAAVESDLLPTAKGGGLA
jgi:hypothetical protein